MKKRIAIYALFLFALSLNAQSYKTVAGIRLGTGVGMTIKHEIFKKTTLEGILQHRNRTNETTASLLIEQHHNVISRRINFYLGGGLHKGWDNTIREVEQKDPFGLTGIVGIEFTPGRLNLSWDYKPAINLVGGDRKFESQSAISLRYVFVKRKKKKINWKFWKKKD